jgi:hypothetical protein
MPMKTAVMTIAVALTAMGCATVPLGPSVMVLPGNGKNFDQFQGDNAACRDWAMQQTGVKNGVATDSTVKGAAVGTVIGAAAGAAVGAAAGHPGMGAAVGAGAGMLGGTATGATAGDRTYRTAQQRYDMAYLQCMYAKGNQIPMRSAPQSSYRTAPVVTPSGPPPPPPPPPAGTPPPPPPGVTR